MKMFSQNVVTTSQAVQIILQTPVMKWKLVPSNVIADVLRIPQLDGARLGLYYILVRILISLRIEGMPLTNSMSRYVYQIYLIFYHLYLQI